MKVNTGYLLKFGLCVCLLLVTAQISHAQIFTDRGKLKTVEGDKKPFILFDRSAKQSNRKKVRKKDVKTRFSSQRGRIKKNRYTPIFSTPLFGKRIRTSSPRFTKRGKIRKSNVNPASASFKDNSIVRAGRPRYTKNNLRGKKSKVIIYYSDREGKAVVKARRPKYTASRKRKLLRDVDVRYTSKRRKPLELAEKPRFSATSRIRKSKVSPRYTDKGHRKIDLDKSPRITERYSRGKKTVVSPRFSDIGKIRIITKDGPRYSRVGKVGKKADISPRYSKKGSKNYKIIFKNGLNVFDYLLAIPGGVILAVRPFDVSFADYKGWLKQKDVDKHEKSNSKYQGSARRDFRIIKNYKNKRRAKNLAGYDGQFKRKTAFFEKISDRKNARKYGELMVPSGYNKRKKEMHPSAINLTVKRIPSKTGKKVVKKLSKFRTKIDGNKTQPPNVRGRRKKKLRFDKNEKGLWNE